MKRLAIERLRQWKESSDRKPLIIRGARQVGKTTLVNQFAEEFDCYLYLNLDRTRDLNLFLEDDIHTLLDKIFFHCQKKKTTGQTLLFIDEIQNSAAAIKQLRYFYEEIPDLYVIAAGSLLESLINSGSTFPVGRVQYLALRPCSFLEFLEGIGEEFDAQTIKQLKGSYVHERLMAHFLNYMLVGGMPAAVVKYAEKRDVLAVDSVYSSLMNSYRDDIEKYAKKESPAAVIRLIINNGWPFAAEQITFNNFAGSNYRSREIGEALQTIERALLLELVYPVTDPKLPFIPNFKRRPKLVWLDTGLVNYMAGVRSEIFNIDEILSVWKGRIAEHITAQELIASDFEFSTRRFFWVRDKESSSAEVDFVVRYRNMMIPVEVKSGHNSKLKSLHIFMDNAPHDIAVRVWPQPYSVDNVTTANGKQFRLINLPFYYVGVLEEVLNNLIPSSDTTSLSNPISCRV